MDYVLGEKLCMYSFFVHTCNSEKNWFLEKEQNFGSEVALLPARQNCFLFL